MKPFISIIERRLPTLVVGAAALLLMPGCHFLNTSSFQAASNPRVCPTCIASTPEECHCFPSDVGAGYNETHWSKLESLDPPGSTIFLHDVEFPTSQLIQVNHESSEGLLEPAEPRRPPDSSELVELAKVAKLAELAEMAELAELVELVELVELAELTELVESAEESAAGGDSVVSRNEPDGGSSELPGEEPGISEEEAIPPVVVAKLPDREAE